MVAISQELGRRPNPTVDPASRVLLSIQIPAAAFGWRLCTLALSSAGPSPPITPILHNQAESGLIIKKNNQGQGIRCIHWCVFFVSAHNWSGEIVPWFQVSLLLISLL